MFVLSLWFTLNHKYDIICRLLNNSDINLLNSCEFNQDEPFYSRSESELNVKVEGEYCKVYEQSASRNKNWIMHLLIFLGMRPSIVTLDLFGILLSEIDIQVIGLLTGIQKLGLDNCSLSSEKLHMLSSLSLQELSLKSNPVSDLGFLKNMRKLKSLNLVKFGISIIFYSTSSDERIGSSL